MIFYKEAESRRPNGGFVFMLLVLSLSPSRRFLVVVCHLS